MLLAHPFILAQVFLHAANLWPIAAVSALVALAAMLVFYPAQLACARWPWRIAIPLLRLFAILILAASLLKPVMMRRSTVQERGVVVMLVDRSRSMGVVDNSRTPAQLVALADAMGKLPAGLRSDASTMLATDLERLRTIAADVRASQEDLDYARISGRDVQYRQKRLHDAGDRYSQAAGLLLEKVGGLSEAGHLIKQLTELAQAPDIQWREAWRVNVPEHIAQAAVSVAQFQEESDNHLYELNNDVRSACETVSNLSRFSLVELALLRPGGVVSRTKKEAALVGMSLAGDIAPMDLGKGNEIVQSLKTLPDGDESDLTAGIARAVSGRAVRAVVLFSDGRQVGGDDTVVSGLTPQACRFSRSARRRRTLRKTCLSFRSPLLPACLPGNPLL